MDSIEQYSIYGAQKIFSHATLYGSNRINKNSCSVQELSCATLTYYVFEGDCKGPSTKELTHNNKAAIYDYVLTVSIQQETKRCLKHSFTNLDIYKNKMFYLKTSNYIALAR